MQHVNPFTQAVPLNDDAGRTKEGRARFASELPMQEQQQGYLSFIETSLRVSSPAEFITLMRDHVQSLLPHGKFIAGIGRILPDFRIQAYQLLPINFPMAYLDSIRCAGGSLQGPIMTRWARTQEPQLYEPLTDSGTDIDPEWLATYRHFELGNQVAHGMHDLFSDVTSYFSFCGVPGVLSRRHSYLCRLLVPHLHVALLHALVRRRASTAEKSTAPSITPREKQLLALLLSGNNNRELANTLKRSEKTIKNQLHALYGKLNVNTRAQAIRRANEFHGERFCMPPAHEVFGP